MDIVVWKDPNNLLLSHGSTRSHEEIELSDGAVGVGEGRVSGPYRGQSSYGQAMAPPPYQYFSASHLTCKHAHAHLAPCSGKADLLAPCYTPFSGLASKTVPHKVET